MDQSTFLENLPEFERKGIAALYLFGMTQALIDPPSLAVFTEAQRIVFTESDEFAKIAGMLSVDVSTLRKNVFIFLERSGVRCQKGKGDI